MSEIKTEKAGSQSSLEKGGSVSPTQDHFASADPRYHFDVHDLDRVQRRLKQRHVQMCVFIFSVQSPQIENLLILTVVL
jgi:hypothetical protein